jgi:hypothetical protein
MGAGVLDDMIETFLFAFVSEWIGTRADVTTGTPATGPQPLHVRFLHPKSGSPAIESARFKLDELMAKALAGSDVATVALRQDLTEEAVVTYSKEFDIDPIVPGC